MLEIGLRFYLCLKQPALCIAYWVLLNTIRATNSGRSRQKYPFERSQPVNVAITIELGKQDEQPKTRFIESITLRNKDGGKAEPLQHNYKLDWNRISNTVEKIVICCIEAPGMRCLSTTHLIELESLN